MAKPPRRLAPGRPFPRIAKKRSGTNEALGGPAAPRPLTPHELRQQRSTYVDAVAIYEQAIRTLQQHHYSKAAELLRHIISNYPEERELAERSRLYITVCERQIRPPVAEPQSSHERLYAATLALNAGQLDRAIGYLTQVTAEEPRNDQALYMLAVAHAQRDEPRVAIPYLQQAIEANPQNRSLARIDPDLEKLRSQHGVAALLGSGRRRQVPARDQY